MKTIRPGVRLALLAAAAALALATPAQALDLIETPTLKKTHRKIDLPPIDVRVPTEPLIVDLAERRREPGVHGGNLRTIIARSKDIRLMVVWGYARLVGYTARLELKPDILHDVDVEDGRIFTLHIREGHKWSDGHPFTAEDFRYYWEDVAKNPKLSPAGPPVFFLVDGEMPTFEVVDEMTVRYSWPKPNPLFLPELAGARPPFIYRPAHYLRQFHERYSDPDTLAALVDKEKVRGWAPLHNRRDEMYNYSNPELPTLQPWVNLTRAPAKRFIMVRNPYYHRVDSSGRQLPYIDRVVMTVADSKLVSAKTNAGESDLQARNLSFADITLLKTGEERSDYQTFLWPIAKGNAFALYPNVTTNDPVWRDLMRDTRFRRALSLGIDRTMINRVLYFGLGEESNNTVLPESPLFKPAYRTAWARYDTAEANRLLDEIGLTERRSDGIRLLPDGRPLEIIVETEQSSGDQIDILELIDETWFEIGAKVFIKSQDRNNLRNRAYAGQLVMGVWEGFDNGLPLPGMSPADFAPTRQDMLCWPKWGQYYDTKGKSGEAPDMPWAIELLDLYKQWQQTTDHDERTAIWHQMLDIHAEEQITIGVVQGVPQPVVAKNGLRNVPAKAMYGWDPGAHFGIHRMDEFFFDPDYEPGSKNAGRDTRGRAGSAG